MKTRKPQAGHNADIEAAHWGVLGLWPETLNVLKPHWIMCVQSVRAAVLPVLVSTIGLASVTDLALVAEAHGCEQLERACVRFAADPDVLCRLWQQPRFLQVLAVHCLVAASACGSCVRVWNRSQRLYTCVSPSPSGGVRRTGCKRVSRTCSCRLMCRRPSDG